MDGVLSGLIPGAQKTARLGALVPPPRFLENTLFIQDSSRSFDCDKAVAPQERKPYWHEAKE